MIILNRDGDRFVKIYGIKSLDLFILSGIKFFERQ